MTPHNCLFQVSLFKGDRLLMSFAWTDDKNAVIEAMDEINLRGCRDLRLFVDEHDYLRGSLILVKNGHKLLTGEPFTLKPLNVNVSEILYLVGKKDRGLRAGVVTKGAGGVHLEQSVIVGG